MTRAVCGDEKKKREVRRRVQAGANAWRAVEGVMADRRISKRLKGKVMSTCVTPACLYGRETLALTELQQQRLQVCENNWVRKIARLTRADRRRMVECRGAGQRDWWGADYSGLDTQKGWRMTDYRRERQSYVSRAGGDEGGQCCDERTVLREMGGRQERKKTGRRSQEADEAVKKLQAAQRGKEEGREALWMFI